VAAIPNRYILAGTPGASLPLAALAGESWILFPASEGPGLHGRTNQSEEPLFVRCAEVVVQAVDQFLDLS
jgi:hypothetical protein